MWSPVRRGREEVGHRSAASAGTLLAAAGLLAPHHQDLVVCLSRSLCVPRCRLGPPLRCRGCESE
jgi:hypothetical protein